MNAAGALPEEQEISFNPEKTKGNRRNTGERSKNLFASVRANVFLIRTNFV
jgi:hypothetical protein